MQDQPTASELLAAVQHFLETEVVVALEGPRKFHARVAANLLAIVQRELACAAVQQRAEWERLDVLLGAESAPSEPDAIRRRIRERSIVLAARIRDGQADREPWRSAVIQHVRQTVIDKLAVANPKYLGAEGAATVHTPGRMPSY